MAEIVHLVEATPYLPGTGTVTVRMSSARSHGRDIGKNSQIWTPALIAAPVQKISFLGDNQLPGIPEISYGALGVRFSPELGNDAWSAYVWEGALTSVWRGVSGAAFGSFTKIFTGRSGALERPGPNAGSIALRGFEGDLDKDLLTATYAGTGAAEGDLAMKGVPKPWLSGRCEGVQGVLVSKVYWVWQLHGYGAIDEVTAAYEGGLSLGAKHGDYANYAALIAASIPDGGWATCLAQGLVRIANEPSKPIVFDARGAKDGATYVSKVGAIATHLIKQAGFDAGSINATSASNLDSAFAHDHGLFAAAQTTIGGAVRKMLADIGGYTFPDENGVWRFGRYKAIKTATPLKSDRTALPIVRSVAQKAALSPVGRVEIGARRCWAVHREDDISPALLDALDNAGLPPIVASVIPPHPARVGMEWIDVNSNNRRHVLSQVTYGGQAVTYGGAEALYWLIVNHGDVTADQTVVSRLNAETGNPLPNFYSTTGGSFQVLVASGEARDGDVVTFDAPLASVPRIRFGAGGVAPEAGENVSIRADNLTVSGFTLVAKSQAATAGAPIVDTGAVSGGTGQPMRVMDKSSADEPYDGFYTFSYNIIVFQMGNFDPGYVEIGVFVKRSGAWVQVGSSAHASSGTKTTRVAPGAVDFGAGAEFGISVIAAEGGAGLSAFNSVTYTPASALSETSLTPAGSSPIPWEAFL